VLLLLLLCLLCLLCLLWYLKPPLLQRIRRPVLQLLLLQLQ